MKIRIAGLVNDSIVDGIGLRYSIYVQGCPHHCRGCHNPESWDYDGGTLMDTETIWQQVEKNPLLDGITFSGGEPMEQPEPLILLARQAKARGLTVWAYSGYTFAELLTKEEPVSTLLSLLDVLVDGAFIEKEKDMTLAFRGSKNQRILDVPKSLSAGEAIWFEPV